MPKIFAIIKKTIIGGGPLGTNFVVFVKPGIAMNTVLSAIIGNVKAGIAVVSNVFSLRIDQKPGIAISTSASGEATVNQKPAFNLTQVNSGTSAKPQSLPGAKITRVNYSLSRRAGGSAATLSTTNTQGWTNQANAQGVNDTTVATFSGNALAVRNGTLQLAYDDSVSKTDLTITNVLA